jgi:hypothetical protein
MPPTYPREPSSLDLPCLSKVTALSDYHHHWSDSSSAVFQDMVLCQGNWAWEISVLHEGDR